MLQCDTVQHSDSARRRFRRTKRGLGVRRVQPGLRVQLVRRELVVPVVGDDRGLERVEQARRRFVVPRAPTGQLREAAAVVVFRRRGAEAQVPRPRTLGEHRRRQVRGQRRALPLLEEQVYISSLVDRYYFYLWWLVSLLS